MRSAVPAPTASAWSCPTFPMHARSAWPRGARRSARASWPTCWRWQGARRVIYVDIHNRAIQGFFNIPVDPLSAVPLLADYFRTPEFADAAIVSPDVGRASMAGKYAELLNLPLVVMHKRRTDFTTTETTHVVGDIEGRRPIIIDDVMAGGSVLKQVDALYDAGATGKACFAITHPVLLPTALERLEDERSHRATGGDQHDSGAAGEAASQDRRALRGSTAGRHHLSYLSGESISSAACTFLEGSLPLFGRIATPRSRCHRSVDRRSAPLSAGVCSVMPASASTAPSTRARSRRRPMSS